MDALSPGPAAHRRRSALHHARHAEALQHSSGTDGAGATGIQVRRRGHPGDLRRPRGTARPLVPAHRVPAVGRDGGRLLHRACAQGTVAAAEWRGARRAVLLHLALLRGGGAGRVHRARQALTTFHGPLIRQPSSAPMRVRSSLGLLVFAMMLTTGCAVVSGKLKPPVPRPGGAGLRVGTAKVDITPMPGFSMAGHAVAGKTARGYWTRLYARVIYLEGDNSDSVVLVVCSLVGIPGGLVDRGAELVRATKGGQHIGRDQIVISATHTHHAPGNFFTAELYNGFASKYGGFDQRLFEFIAQRIAAGIVSAAMQPRAAVLKTGESVIPLL